MYDTLLESHKNSSNFLNLHRNEHQRQSFNKNRKRDSIRNSIFIDLLSNQMSDLSVQNRSFLYKNYLQTKSPNQSPQFDKKQQLLDEDNASRPLSSSSLGSFSSHSSSSCSSNKQSSSCLTSIESLNSDQELHENQGSADSGIISGDSLPSPEQRILQEILDTESVYVSDLHDVLKGYLHFWTYECDNCPFMDQLPDLFSNLQVIYEFNRKFLEDLRGANYDAIAIANVFIKSDNWFGVYNTYCTHYPQTMKTYEQLMQDKRIAKMFRERQNCLNHSLSLYAYLLTPIQRILKYSLLLQRLSKELKQPLIDLAIATMTGIAQNINDMIAKHEHAIRVQEIQSKLIAWNGADLTTFGELCAEGTFRVNGSRSRRHVFLFDKVFLITKAKSDGSLCFKFHILNSNLMLVESVRNEPLSFQVLPFNNPRMQCTFNARSLEHKKEWTLQLKRAILENYEAIIPNHARQLVLQLGQNINLEECNNRPKSNDKWSPLMKHYSTPHYLERRCRFRKSYGTLTSSRRTTSQDRSFNLKSAWRRKSDPNNRSIEQYDSKTAPKKIINLKKAKNENSKFYVDMLCEPEVSESAGNVDNITPTNTNTDNNDTITIPTIEVSMAQDCIENDNLVFNNVTDLILKHSKKSESLPRSFQLTDSSHSNTGSCLGLNECSVTNSCETLNMTDDCPEHRIYRQSIIRFSLIQKFKSMIAENEKSQTDSPTYKQGSKSMGAKIAQTDYADPNKFIKLTCNGDKNDPIPIIEPNTKLPDEKPKPKPKPKPVLPNKPNNLKSLHSTKLVQMVKPVRISSSNNSWVQTVINRFE